MLDDRDYMRQPSRFEARWSATVILIVINVVAFVIQMVASQQSPNFVNQLGLSVDGLKSLHLWQPLTFQFLHENILHLLFNMLSIYIFGNTVEETLGRSGFVKLYLLSGAVGGLVQMGVAAAWPGYFGGPLVAPFITVIGASAGAYGLVAAYAALFPHRPLYLFFLPIEIKAKFLLWFSIAMSVIGICVADGHVAHWAHLGGLLAGLFYIRFITHAQKPLVLWQQPRGRRRELVNARHRQSQFWRRPRETKQDDLPASEFISKEVDPILDKISAHGIHSLTPQERQVLQDARAKMSKR